MPGAARVAAALCAPALAFFAPALVFGRALYLRDVGLYFEPHKALIARALRAGRLPEWNPLEYCGMPLLVDPNFNAFHPLSALALFPRPWGFAAFVCANALLSAAGAYALGRTLGLSRGAGTLAALAWAWSGPHVSLLESGPSVAAAALPWVCAAGAALGRALEERRPAARAGAGLAGATALACVSGTPELGACALALAAALAVARAGSGRRARALVAWAGACALGMAVAAVQVLPTALYLRAAARGEGFSFAEATADSLHPLRLPGLVLPFFAGAIDAPGAGWWIFARAENPWVLELYSGVLVCALALVGLGGAGPPAAIGSGGGAGGGGGTRGPRALAVAALALVVVALGGRTPLYRALWAVLPPLRLVRYPEKLVVPWALAVAILSGAGWDGALARLRGWRPGALGAGAAVAAVAALGAALAAGWPPAAIGRWLGPARASSLAATALPSLALELGLLALALCAAALVSSGTLAPRRTAPVLAALVALELGVPAARLDFTVPADALLAQAPAAALAREAAGDGRVDAEDLGLSTEALDALGAPDWPRPRRRFWAARQALLGAGPALEGLRMARGYSGFTPGALRAFFQAPDGREALWTLGVRVGVERGDERPSVFARLGFEPFARSDAARVRIWRAPEAGPRLRLVEAALPLANIGPVRCGDRRLVSLSAADRALLPPGLAAAGCESLPVAAEGEVALAGEEPERIAARVRTRRPALVLLADAWDAGWRAAVDGAPVASLAADGALRAVAVPAGEHTVEWTYRTPGLEAGAAISVVGLVIVALLGRRRGGA